MIDREKVADAVRTALAKYDERDIDGYEAAGDAAIASVLGQLKEPSLGMVIAGTDARDSERTVYAIWQAMLSASLRQSEEEAR